MRALLLLTLLAATVLTASARSYVYSRALRQRRPVSYLIRRSPNPRMGLCFVEAQLSRRVLEQLLSARYPQLDSALLERLASQGGGQQLPPEQLRTLLQGPYRRLVQPIYPALLPYYLYNRAGSRLFSKKSLLSPLRRLTPSDVQLQFLRFLTRIDRRLVSEPVGDDVLSAVRQSLVDVNSGYGGLSVPLLRNLYGTFVSVIGGNGRSRFLLGLSPQRRLQHFSTSLGLYLRAARGQLPALLKNSALLYQDFAGDVDSRYILHSSGIRLLGELERQQESEADRFFLELEHDHFEAVNDVLSSIFRVQRSLSLSSLPRLGYSGVLARRFYPGLDVAQTDVIARYILRALSSYGAISGSVAKAGGLLQSLPYLPYVRGLPVNTVSSIQQADLASVLGSLNLSGLRSRLTPEVLQAARGGPFITQALLASLLHGVRFTSPQQGVLLFRDLLASLLMHEKRFDPAQFTSFLGDPIRPFVLLNRIIVPNTLPAIRRIPQIQLLPLNSILSLRGALQRGIVQLPPGLARRARLVLRPRRVPLVPVPEPEPTPVVVTEPPFPSIVVSRVSIGSAAARRLFALLSGGIPVLTVGLLQPVLQLLVERQVVPVALLRAPDQLEARLQDLLKALQPLVSVASQAATVPSFVTDKTFTADSARVAYILDLLVIYSRGYTVLEAPLISSSVIATLRSYYTANRAFEPIPFLAYSDRFFPQLIAQGLLARPLRLGSSTLSPATVTATLAGLRPAYGPVTYHGLASVLGYRGAAPLLSGVDLTDPAALVRALTFGASKPAFQLSESDVSGLQEILKPITLFDRQYSLADLQFLFSFGVRELRIPRSIYGGRLAPLFRESLTSFIATRKSLIADRAYNPAYLRLVVDQLLVDKLTSGELSPRVQVRIPSGRLTLRRSQVSRLVRRSLLPLQLRLLPPFVGQLLTVAVPEVRLLRHAKPASLLSSFGQYLGSAPFSRFRFSLTDDEFSGVLGTLTRQRRLPGFFLRYPSRLQRYYLDNLFGSFAAYSLLRYNAQELVTEPLSHSALFDSFSTSLVPSFFKGHKFSGLGDLLGVAPDYFTLCRRTFSTLPGLQAMRPPVHIASAGGAPKGGLLHYGKYHREGGFFTA
ncbi:uncharacterized protein LOC122365302 [Amphibalanus amphitrite]|uniref:uncharacterized protein LOC122365302 n=1 Tax=Amphibalanus amphitrite TaxID=1232801 RepID=UPI001C9138CD|nr:uncharacterized protein LOC122365302 [Amphibalanus amphitrite]